MKKERGGEIKINKEKIRKIIEGESGGDDENWREFEIVSVE